MQKPTAFDLNGAIENWRRRLAASPAFQPRDLRELESHLRDAIERLRSPQLSDEDCFVLAVHRLGSEAMLAAEFGKVNRGNIWSERAMWMLAGSLLVGFVTGVAGTVSRIFVLMTQNAITNRNWLSGLSAVIAPSLFLLAILFVWRMLRRPPAFLQAGLRAVFQNRAVAVAVLLLMTSFSALIGLFSIRHVVSMQSAEATGRIMVAQTWSAWTMTIASSLFIIITFACLVKRHLESDVRPSNL